MSEIQCPVCRVAIEEGLVLDHGHNNSLTQSVWVEGTPEPSLWAGIKTRGRRLLSTVTYRCPTRGLLQSYARQEYVDFI